jgi:hypothetical protein
MSDAGFYADWFSEAEDVLDLASPAGTMSVAPGLEYFDRKASRFGIPISGEV